MTDTGRVVPSNVYNANARTPHWTNPQNIENVALPGSSQEGGDITTPFTTVSIPVGAYSDSLKSNEYGFRLPLNAKIGGISARILRSGALTKDYIVSILIDNISLSNKAKMRQRTDEKFLDDTYGSSTDLWGASSILPSQVNDDNGFGLKTTIYNNDTVSNTARIHGMGLRVYYTNPTYSITGSMPSKAVVGSRINYSIFIENTNSIDNGEPIPIEVPIPIGFELVSYFSEQGIYNELTGIWNPILTEDGYAELYLTLECMSTGVQSQTVTEIEFNTSLTQTCEIVASDSENIYKTEATITDIETLNNLIDGEVYTLSVYSKVHDPGLPPYDPYLWDGIRNNRLAIVNGDEIIGGRAELLDIYERVSVTFRYDAAEPLIFRMYGQYEEVSTSGQDEWAGFTLKKGYDTTYNPRANLINNPEALLDDVITTICNIPANEEIGDYYYLIDTIPPQDGIKPFIKGMQLILDCEDRINSGVEVQLISSNGNSSKIKTKTFDNENPEIFLGDDNDMWGLISEDIMEHEVTIKIKFTNISLNPITSKFGNLRLILFWMDDETNGASGFKLDGVHSRNYNLFMTDFNVPEGPAKDTTSMNLGKMDGELITDQTIKTKQIEIGFDVWGNSLPEAKSRLVEISKWLNNDRNALKIPIVKELIFDHAPEERYMVVLSDAISTDLDIFTYKCNAKFNIPSGVSLNVEPKSTGPIGTNDGLIRVRPLITILADGSSSIVISDSVSGQVLTINHTFEANTILLIDNEARKVKDSNGTDYTQYVSINSIWFDFIKNYDLSCSGGIIQNIEFYEGT